MNVWKLLAALPLLAGGLWAETTTAGSGPVLPEKVFPALDDILRAAVHQAPRMLDRAIDLEIAENDRITGRAGLLPGVSGYYRYYESRDKRHDLELQHLDPNVDVKKVYYDFSITQPVFFWGERKNTARMAEIRQHISQGNYREAYRLFAQEIRQRYLAIVTEKVAVRRARFNQKFAREQLAIAEDRLARKVISDVDIEPARLNAERADLDVEHTTFDLQSSREAFARVTGTPVLAEEAIPDSVPVLNYVSATYDNLVDGYVSQKDLPTTEAANMRYQLQVQQLEYKNQKVRLRPKFSLVAGATQDEQNYGIADPKYQINSLYAGASVSWTLFDGFASQAGVRNALAHRRQTENDYRDLTARLIQQARDDRRQLYFSARNMSLDDRYLKAAEAAINTRKDDFSRGVGSESDISLAQLSAYDAQLVSYNQRIDFMLKVSGLLGLLNEDPILEYAPAN